MTRPDGTPYGLPLNLVRKDETTFYFHCAADGEKIDCLKHNPIISLSAVSRCTPKYEEEKNNFTEYFNSAIAIGKADIITDDSEKIEALRLLCERFLPKYMEHFDEAIARSINRTTVVRITLTKPPVGKSKPQPTYPLSNLFLLYGTDYKHKKGIRTTINRRRVQNLHRPIVAEGIVARNIPL